MSADAPDVIRRMFLDDYTQFRRIVSEQVLFSAMVQADEDPEKSRQGSSPACYKGFPKSHAQRNFLLKL